MILQELVKYYEALAERGEIALDGWRYERVAYSLELNAEGKLLKILSLGSEDKIKKRSVRELPLMKVPHKEGAQNRRKAAIFLCDNAEHMLGLGDGTSDRKSKKYFAATKEELMDILKDCDGPAASALKKFFQSWDPSRAEEFLKQKDSKITKAGNLIFSIEGKYAQDIPELQQAWEGWRKKQEKKKGEEKKQGKKKQGKKKQGEIKEYGRCLVTGEFSEIERTHTLIKGIKKTHPNGAALVSFNAPAFYSYGKEQSFNAPVGKREMFSYTTALQFLLTKTEQKVKFGDLLCLIFWAESGEKEYGGFFSSCLEGKEDNQEITGNVLRNVAGKQGVDYKGVHLDPEQNFCILGLSGHEGRLAVRLFLKNSFGDILRNFQRFYEELEIAGPEWAEEQPALRKLLEETVNQNSRDKSIPPALGSECLRAILVHGKFPASLYHGILIRIRADQGRNKINRRRAALIKAILLRNYGELYLGKGEDFVALNENCRDRAYILGREFAVLEKIQGAANSTVNATIRDRYFNSACGTPAMVFPLLFRLKESHLRKIRNENPGLAVFCERILTELQGMLEVSESVGAFPSRLSLNEQGMFILGYYHQRQKFYEKKEGGEVR